MPARESVELDLSREGREGCEFHVLPCSIDHEGAIDASKFAVEKSPTLFTRLRGRPLQGRAVDLALWDYCGVCVDRVSTSDPELDSEEADEEPRHVQAGSSFGSIVVWEHGKEPAADDAWGGRLEDLLRMSATLEQLQDLQ